MSNIFVTTTRPITYSAGYIPPSTTILIDPIALIGFYNGHHFDVFPDEYTLDNHFC